MHRLFYLTLIYLLPLTSPTLLSSRISIRCHDNRFMSIDGNNKQLTCTNKRPQMWEHFDLEKVGNKIAIKTHLDTYCSAEVQGSAMRCDKTSENSSSGKINETELFELVDNEDGTVFIKCVNGSYLSSGSETSMECKNDKPGEKETFRILLCTRSHNCILEDGTRVEEYLMDLNEPNDVYENQITDQRVIDWENLKSNFMLFLCCVSVILAVVLLFSLFAVLYRRHRQHTKLNALDDD